MLCKCFVILFEKIINIYNFLFLCFGYLQRFIRSAKIVFVLGSFGIIECPANVIIVYYLIFCGNIIPLNKNLVNIVEFHEIKFL